MRTIVISLLYLSTLPCCFAQTQPAIDVAWLPVTDAERNMKAPLVDKDAGVEALFWRVHVRDEMLGGRELQRVFYHYVRLKIFDEKGKEKASTIELPFGDKTAIIYVYGRTIKADGTELELKKDSIFERDLVRAGHLRTKVKSFAMPGVEPGAIVEYRWKEVLSDSHVMHARLQFQREYPVQKVTYFVHPLSGQYTTYQMFALPFNCKPSALKREENGFSSTTLENVPAFREEPMMPGEPTVRPWVLVAYRENGKFPEPEKYWNNAGKEMYNDFLRQALKPNDDVRRAAASAIEGATTDEQKIGALIRYIRKNVRNLFGATVTEAERSKIFKEMPQNRLRTSPEVLKSGIGTANEMNTLFASMASSVGLEARPALVADRQDLGFVPELADRYFLPTVDMAVNIAGKWKLYDVSARLLPSGMLSWREEGMKALLSDPKRPMFIESPDSPPEASAGLRSAKLALSEDGTIEGDIDQEYSGHMAVDRRYEMDGEAETRRLERLKEQYVKIFPDAEVSDVRIENAENPEQALKLHCHIKIPGYAQRTGKRLLLQPLFFQRGVAPLFTATERRYPVDLHYAWQERDRISILLPSGFALDHAENPGALNFGAPGSYELKMSVQGGRELVCERGLTFGREGALAYSVQAYPKLKNLFDEVHRRDDVTISLKHVQEASTR
jgi:hypothetical protein